MSKSLGNFVSIKEILEKYHPEALKLFFLSAHYRSPVDFSFKKMEEAQAQRERFYILFDRIGNYLKGNFPYDSTLAGTSTKRNCEARAELPCEIDDLCKEKEKSETKLKEIHEFPVEIDSARSDFEKAMNNDFNTPAALAALFTLVGFANRYFEERSAAREKRQFVLNKVKAVLIELGRLLGLFENVCLAESKLEDEMLKLVKERERARETGDFKKADRIRVRLAEKGVILEDGPAGTTWRKK